MRVLQCSAVVAALAFAQPARATCAVGDCPIQLERTDGTVIEADAAGAVRLEPGQPFVVRKHCEVYCSPGTSTSISYSERAMLVAIAPGGQSACPIEPRKLGAPIPEDPGAYSVSNGLVAGHYWLDRLRLVVGDSLKPGDCPPSLPQDPDELDPPPPPPAQDDQDWWPGKEGGAARPGSDNAMEVSAVMAEETPSAPPSPTDWDGREGALWELAVGPWGGVAFGKTMVTQPSLGVVVGLGLHGLVHWRRGELDFDALSLCTPMPLACGVLGLFFAPTGAVVGNEMGLELRGALGGTTTDADALTRFGVRPYFRFASGTLRTQSFVGSLLPEVGVQLQQETDPAVAIAWSVYPVDWRFHAPFALSVDPLRFGVIPNGDTTQLEVGGELTLRYAP